MLLQKTLHMNQSLEECKTRLASIQSYRRQFVMVTKATVTSSKTVDFSFRGPLGFEARTVLLSVESESPDQMVFESTGGNLDVMGLAEFTEIRPNCTEFQLACTTRSRQIVSCCIAAFISWMLCHFRLRSIRGISKEAARLGRAPCPNVRDRDA